MSQTFAKTRTQRNTKHLPEESTKKGSQYQNKHLYMGNYGRAFPIHLNTVPHQPETSNFVDHSNLEPETLNSMPSTRKISQNLFSSS